MFTVLITIDYVYICLHEGHKGVRQGGLLYPILFNLVADSLTRMVHQAQQCGTIKGLVDDLIQNGVAILQYADDTIMCLKHCLNSARNLKILLYIYEQMSGLKINFGKSEIVSINGDNEIKLLYATLFNCQVGQFPIKYLGVHVSSGRLHVVDWASMEEKSYKKIDVWQGSATSMGGRKILIAVSLRNSHVYHMSMFLLPKTVVKRTEMNCRKFFWQGNSKKKSTTWSNGPRCANQRKKEGWE